jgi:hypothetical protein
MASDIFAIKFPVLKFDSRRYKRKERFPNLLKFGHKI